MNTNEAYVQAIRDCVICGDEVSPRGHMTYEIMAHTVQFDMNYPIITIPERAIDYPFMVAEAYWILSGNDKLDKFVRKNLEKYSDDGETMFGAYGPPFVEQVRYVVRTLTEDITSRQACMTLWQRSPRKSKDIPCTMALQFLIRNDTIHMNVFMRSQDVWLGLPYDIFTFSMMAWYVSKWLPLPLKLGTLSIHAGSRHLYDRHLEVSQDMVATWFDGEKLAICSHRFISPDLIVNALGDLRNCPTDLSLNYIHNALC